MRIAAIFLCCPVFCSAQFSDDFSDGDFTDNPSWTGNTEDFIVNSSNQLQSNNTTANTSFYLVTQSTLCTSAQWEFYVKIDFNPSSKNYIDVYLTSALPNLLDELNFGYFVRIGNTLDQISLYIKKKDGSLSELIKGTTGILNKSKNSLKIKVTRTSADQWTLMRDLTGSGNNYTEEGNIVDATFETSSYFGILITQSTSGFFKKHYFDIVVKPLSMPIDAQIVYVSASTGHSLDILLNTPVNSLSASNINNYFLDNNIGTPLEASTDANNSSLLHLTFQNPFPDNTNVSLTINNLMDINGNILHHLKHEFLYHDIKPFDIVIDEIMADPKPQVGLPEAEWVELKNTTNYSIDLNGWKIGKEGKLSKACPHFDLGPDSFVILCKPSNADLLSTYGKVISLTNFPVLKNNADTIFIASPDNKIIHGVNYTTDWYQDVRKSKGGWSLEMINSNMGCIGESNWRASLDNSGGTPGRKNSVESKYIELSALEILTAFAKDATTIILQFNKSVDSLQSCDINNYKLSDGLSIKGISVLPPLFNTVELKITTPLIINKIYTLSVKNIRDCTGTVIDVNSVLPFGLADTPDTRDIVINEILFHPHAGGSEYLELYNHSEKLIDLKNIFVATRNKSNKITGKYAVSESNNLFYPHTFILLARDTNAVLHEYNTLNRKSFLQDEQLPKMPNDTGNIIVLNKRDLIVDEVAYSEKWHFSLLTNTEGISLERKNYSGPSDASNFHSASSSVGYGTPGYKNSQQEDSLSVDINIKITPEVISPDNDGTDDYALISYQLPHNGYLASISIYDIQGRPVRLLQKNALTGTNGEYIWDGYGENKKKLEMGPYIILTELIDTANGKRYRDKKLVTIARR